jgi:hypothetical protein
MSGNTVNTANATSPASTTRIFTQNRSEFGLYDFADPLIQKQYKQRENKYKRMMYLKDAYENQKFLQEMCKSMKREYNKRKKQMKKLQEAAAIQFRNYECLLQKYYYDNEPHEEDDDHEEENATSERNQRHYQYSIDVDEPLVSKIHLPNDTILDLEAFDIDKEFEAVVEYHMDLELEQYEKAKIKETQEDDIEEFEITPTQAATQAPIQNTKEQDSEVAPESESTDEIKIDHNQVIEQWSLRNGCGWLNPESCKARYGNYYNDDDDDENNNQ